MFMMFWVLLFISVLILCVVCWGNSFILSNAFFSISGMDWNMVFCFDNVTLGILTMLCICFSYAYFYTGHYFSGDSAGLKLNVIISLFVAVMATLVLTGDLLFTLVLWEYLGVVSFFLILFYLNYLSLRSSVVTLVSSRFGDVCLFLLIATLCFQGYYYSVTGVLLFFILFTKSAGYPFISWLLEAMRAPTPVSSLVHSSTLVAAGVWFAMRYDIFMSINTPYYFVLLLLLTTCITGICCFFFLDLKKIVALSTCNNISWCLVYLIFGDVTLSLFQLVSHGVSKCLLFMLVGDVMSGTGGSQASNCVYSPQLYGNWGTFGLISVVLGLSGVPFLGVFFTKHFMLSTLWSGCNINISLFVLICVFLSYFYSFRLCSVILNTKVSVSSGVLFSFASGIMLYFWLLVNYYLAGLIDETTSLSSMVSITLVVYQVLSLIIAWLFYSSVMLSNWCSSIFGCDNLVEAAYNSCMSLYNNCALFIFRWDNSMIKLFNGYGVFSMNILNYNLLNIIMFSTFVMFMCLYIVY